MRSDLFSLYNYMKGGYSVGWVLVSSQVTSEECEEKASSCTRNRLAEMKNFLMERMVKH